MFKNVGEPSWIASRLDSWWPAVKPLLRWLVITAGATLVGAAVFLRDEFAPPDVQQQTTLSRLLEYLPWYAFIILALVVLFVVTVEGIHRLSVAQKEHLVVIDRRISDLEAQLQARQKSQGIADAMLEERAKAIAMLNQRVQTADEYAAWKQEWLRWSAALLTRMRALGCSSHELHGAQRENIGAVQPLHVGKDSDKPGQSKAVLFVQIKHIESLIAQHDTMRPVWDDARQ